MTEPCSPGQPGGYPSDCEILEGYRSRVREAAQSTIAGSCDPVILEKAKNIRLLLLDVDGVLTDGTLFYGEEGECYKPFNTQDGFGIKLLQEAEIEVGIITARESEMVRRLGEELKLDHLYQGYRKKLEAYRQILKSSGYKPFEIAYMGDDWLDLPVLQLAGLSISPADGVEEVKAMVNYVTPRGGGKGAVRDACNLLLSAQGKYDRLLRQYSTG